MRGCLFGSSRRGPAHACSDALGTSFDGHSFGGGSVSGVVLLQGRTLTPAAVERVVFLTSVVEVKIALDPLQKFQVVERLGAA